MRMHEHEHEHARSIRSWRATELSEPSPINIHQTALHAANSLNIHGPLVSFTRSIIKSAPCLVQNDVRLRSDWNFWNDTELGLIFHWSIRWVRPLASCGPFKLEHQVVDYQCRLWARFCRPVIVVFSGPDPIYTQTERHVRFHYNFLFTDTFIITINCRRHIGDGWLAGWLLMNGSA